MNQNLQYLLQARFSNNPPPGYKRREGPVFMLGDYPNKQFSLSAEEADAAIARFQPVQGDVEHMPTVLSGHLGILRRVWRDGQTLFGAADVPEWLDNILDGTKSGISLAWERAEKDIKGWGWTLDPAIKVAKLTTAFSNATGLPATAGGTVNTPAVRPTPTETPRQRKEKRLMPIIDRLGKRIALFAAGAGSEPTPEPVAPPTPITPGPSITVPTPAPAPATTTTPAPTPTLPATNFTAPGIDEPEMDEATANFKADQIANTAEREADALINAGHFYSAQRPLLLALFTAAGYDNEAHGASLVTFSRANGSVIQDRVEMLREVFTQQPTHSLFSAELPVNILNGNRAPGEVQSAVQQGDEQAKKFNAEHYPTMAAPASTNGNGQH